MGTPSYEIRSLPLMRLLLKTAEIFVNSFERRRCRLYEIVVVYHVVVILLYVISKIVIF
jgi:hypothetical protein